MTRDEVAALLKNQADAKARALRSLAMGDPGPLFDTPELSRRSTALEVRLPLPPSWNRAFRTAAMPTKQRPFSPSMCAMRVAAKGSGGGAQARLGFPAYDPDPGGLG